MNPRRVTLSALAIILLLSGCATTDTELTQKEKDKIARDMARQEQQQQQAQAKQMREATQGTKSPRALR